MECLKVKLESALSPLCEAPCSWEKYMYEGQKRKKKAVWLFFEEERDICTMWDAGRKKMGEEF
jgi:hypothetical protein